MQITIHQSADLKDSTKAVINDKIKKLATYYDRIERADVHIRTDDGNPNSQGYTVQCRLAIPGNDVFAEHTDQSIKRGIAEVAEGLRRQLKKHKEKQNDHQASPPAANALQVDDSEAAEDILLSEEQL